MRLASHIMEFTHAYRLWQAPFVDDKFAPVIAHTDMRRVRRVLDVGCGPGTNARNFRDADYIGIDHNAAYIDYARRHHRGDFVVADASSYRVNAEQRFDFILANSFLHHIDTANARHILSHLNTLLSEDGHLHIVEILRPERSSIPRLLARWDRGDFPRPLQEWVEIIGETFDPVVTQPFSLCMLGIRLWDMVYFKCQKKT